MSAGAKHAAFFFAVSILLVLSTDVCAQEQPRSDADGAQLSGGEWMQGADHEKEQPGVMSFTATAYTLDGKTAAGTVAREGIVAADPDVLPLGTRIRVSGAGKHSGEYVVEDTGPKIQGRKIDIKMDSEAEAKQFGERTVQVEVLRHGATLE